MKNSVARIILICLSFVFVNASVNGQDRTLSAAAGDRYVISARAGAVNFVEGSATVSRKAGKGGQLLKGDTVEIGDLITTASDGKVEILLNPGSYLRLGGNASFEFRTTDLDDLQLKLTAGSGILEVFAAEEFKVAVATPNANYLLVETGVYRVDVTSDRQSRIRVWKGGARVGTTYALKPGRAALADGSDISVAKFDRSKKDALDTWSSARSKELAKSSARLVREDLRSTLMRSFLGRRWSVFNSFGLWVYDSFLGGYCFLPFGDGWSTPYGYGFNQSMWWFDLPPVVYYPPPHSGGTNSGGGSNQPSITPVVSSGNRSPVPPFVRMEQSMGGGRGGAPDRGNGSYDSSSSSPSYTPPPTSSSTSSSSSSLPMSSPKTDSPPPTKQP